MPMDMEALKHKLERLEPFNLDDFLFLHGDLLHGNDGIDVVEDVLQEQRGPLVSSSHCSMTPE